MVLVIHYAVIISRKLFPKTGHKPHFSFLVKCVNRQNRVSKLFYKISSRLENILKLGLPLWFYKNNFHFKKITFSIFIFFSVKSNKYHIITETHNKLSIWVPTSYTGPTIFSVRSQLLPSSNSTFSILGVKLSKMSKFYPSIKKMI